MYWDLWETFRELNATILVLFSCVRWSKWFPRFSVYGRRGRGGAARHGAHVAAVRRLAAAVAVARREAWRRTATTTTAAAHYVIVKMLAELFDVILVESRLARHGRHAARRGRHRRGTRHMWTTSASRSSASATARCCHRIRGRQDAVDKAVWELFGR